MADVRTGLGKVSKLILFVLLLILIYLKDGQKPCLLLFLIKEQLGDGLQEVHTLGLLGGRVCGVLGGTRRWRALGVGCGGWMGAVRGGQGGVVPAPQSRGRCLAWRSSRQLA